MPVRLNDAVRARLFPDRRTLDAAYKAARRERWRRRVGAGWKATETEDWPESEDAVRITLDLWR